MKQSETRIKLKCGQIITGCWERKSYSVTRLLGRGGTGLAYLVKDRQGAHWAMKISTDVASITHEHRILRYLNNLSEIKGLSIVPGVMELDDFRIGGQVYHYIITRYCRGVNLGRHSGALSLYHAACIGRQVAEFLTCLHDRGFVFGDLKPGNLVYDFKRRVVNIVDFGSVTVKGQALKQYTPGYDRQSWGAGSRTADEAYDAFALGMLLTTLRLGKSSSGNKTDLGCFISQTLGKVNNPMLRDTIAKALKQENLSCQDIAERLTCIIKGKDDGYSGADAWFVRIVGAASVAAFILSLVFNSQ